MNKKLIIAVIIILLINIGLSGCFKNSNNGSSENNGSKANLIMTDWHFEKGNNNVRGDYVDVFMVIINNGTDDAVGGTVQIISTNQNDLLEANKTRYLSVLSPNGTCNVSFQFDYETESDSLNNKITIRWDDVSREYFEVIYLKD